MQTDLQQSAINAASSPASAASVSVATFGTGISTILELIPPMMGAIASVLGVVLTIILIITHLKRWQLMGAELELKDRQIKAIDERKSERDGY